MAVLGHAAGRASASSHRRPVVIMGVLFRSNGIGTEMVDAKSGFTVRKPAFAAETVHAPKGELVTQPRPVRGVILLAAWCMAPHMHGVGVVENLHVTLWRDWVVAAQPQV